LLDLVKEKALIPKSLDFGKQAMVLGQIGEEECFSIILICVRCLVVFLWRFSF